MSNETQFLHYWNISNNKNKRAKWKLIKNKRKTLLFFAKAGSQLSFFITKFSNKSFKSLRLWGNGLKAKDMRCVHHSFVQMQININKAYNLVVKVAPRYAVNMRVNNGFNGVGAIGWGGVQHIFRRHSLYSSLTNIYHPHFFLSYK